MELPENVSQELTLKEYLEILRRRKWAVLETFGIVLVIGVLATAITIPIFRAEAKILVRATDPSVNTLDTTNPLVDLLALTQPETVDTQIEVLQSGPFLERVLAKAGAGPGSRQQPQIKATRVRDTAVIDIAVESSDRKLAARVANAMVGEYLDYTREVSLAEIKSARRFVQKQRDQTGRALQKAEQDLLEFRKSHRVTQLTAEQESRTKGLVDLETHSRENQNAITRVAAQIHEVQGQLDREPTVKRVPTGRQNPARDALEAKLADLETQRAALLAEYRPQSPMLAPISAQIDRVKQGLAAEPEERVTALTSPNLAREELRARLKELDRDLRGLQAERDQLSAQLVGERQRVDQLGPWEVQLAQLNRARETAQKSFLMLDEKLQDLMIRENARRSGARVLETAAVPGAPVRPRKSVNLIMAAMLGLILGFSVAFLQEYLDDRITTSEEVDRTLGLPVLGRVPLIPSQHSPLMTAMPARGRVPESYRGLRTAIGFAAVDHPLRTLLVSSAVEGEGKSVTALNLAIAMAIEGRRVIVVDTDLRHPTVHRLLEQEMTPGLTEVLVGTAELEATLREVEGVPGLRVLTSGSLPPNPAELVNSVPMEAVIQRLAGEADVVIFDSPPCLPVTDAVLLSAKVDGVLLVADIGQARRGGLKYTQEQLERARARLVGLVFNKVSENQGDTYYSYYHRGYLENGHEPGNGHSNRRTNGRIRDEQRRALGDRSESPEEPAEW